MSYRLRTYDTSFIQDFHGIDNVNEYASEDAAIKAAEMLLNMLYQPSDMMELQIYISGLNKGEWCMIGAVHYVGDDNMTDTDIVFDECYC